MVTKDRRRTSLLQRWALANCTSMIGNGPRLIWAVIIFHSFPFLTISIYALFQMFKLYCKSYVLKFFDFLPKQLCLGSRSIFNNCFRNKFQSNFNYN